MTAEIDEAVKKLTIVCGLAFTEKPQRVPELPRQAR
jgi:hypothetical protein